LLREGGITAVVTTPNEGFARACAAAAIELVAETSVQSITLAEAVLAKPVSPVVIKAGLWPGVQRPDPQVAGATRSLWMDQNCSLVRYVRALYPRLPCVLGYSPDRDAGVSPDQLLAFDSLELALVEAWVSGGNYVMALHPRFREALLNGASDAVSTWRRIGRTARWLRAHENLFRQPPLSTVTVLVDDGHMSEEIAHLSFRQNVSPALVAAANPPAPDPAHCRVLVAAGIEPPQNEAKKRILANAEAGTTLVVDGHNDQAWWRVQALKLLRTDAERNFYALGKGRIVAYKEDIEDPGMLALDVIDILTQNSRPARIWNCNAGLVMASLAPRTGPVQGTALLNVLNYSRPVDLPVLARVQGSFKHARLLRPEADPLEVRVAPRAAGSEVTIPRLERLATVVFW
jgi:hypothetical protein